MAGGFPVSYQFCPFSGSAPTSAHGLSVTPSASANTTGAWIELIPATAYDSSWLVVTFQHTGTATALNTVCINISTGTTGNESGSIIVNNLVLQQDSQAGLAGQCAVYWIPTQITAGTRISANAQSSGASSAAMQVSVIPIAGAFGCISGGSGIDTYGFSTAATKGTVIDPGGTAATKGAYSEIVSSLSYDIAGFVLGFDASTTSGSSALSWTVDVSVGSLGNEVVILPDFQLYGRGSGTTYKAIYPPATPFIPIQIPAGSRVSIRAQCNSITSVVRVFGVTFYGVRL